MYEPDLALNSLLGLICHENPIKLKHSQIIHLKIDKMVTSKAIKRYIVKEKKILIIHLIITYYIFPINYTYDEGLSMDQQIKIKIQTRVKIE